MEISKKERLQQIINVLKENKILEGLTPEKLRIILESLGPTFIKIGQIMASRNDLLKEDYCNELAKLRNKVKPMDYNEVELILKEEYLEKYEEIFASIDEHPIGSASIAQVHGATLKNGDKVVIKVQRQNIKEKMYMDIELLKQAVNILHLESVIHHIIDINSFLDDIYKSALEEMNFKQEATYMEKFRKNNINVPYIKVPKVYTNYVTSNVLIMEKIEGLEISDTEALKKNGYNLKTISELLANSYIKQAIYDGLFQADPHPNNFKIQEDKIVYLDFGMMGKTSEQERYILEDCIKNIVKENYYEIVDNIIALCNQKEYNHQKLETEVKIILEKYSKSSLNEISVVSFFNDFYAMLKDNDIKLPKDITMLIRGIIVIEGLLKELNPEISLFVVLANKVKEREIEKIKSGEYLKTTIKQAVATTENITKIPEEILKITRNINNGEVKAKVELHNSNKQVDKIETMLHQLVIGLLDVAFIIGASLMARDSNESLRNIYLFIALVLSIWLFIKMYIDHKTKGM